MSGNALEGRMRLAEVHNTSGANQPSGPSSTFTVSDKNAKLTAFKKIGFSARRALALMSRSIDHRGAARCGSDGDLFFESQAGCGDSSPCTPIPALAHEYPRDSFGVQHAMSVPSPAHSWMDVNNTVEAARPKEDRRQLTPIQPLQPPQQPVHLAPSAPSAPALSAPPLKPRSLLSALLKRQPATSASAASAAADGAKPSATIPAPAQRHQTAQPPPNHHQPPSMTCDARPPERSSGPGSPQAAPPSPPGSQQARSLGRMYESMPAQQDRRDPVPHPLLVPPRPRRSAAPDRIDMCLSAPSPHTASLRQAMLEMERSEGHVADVAAALPPRPPPPLAAAPCSSSAPIPASAVPTGPPQKEIAPPGAIAGRPVPPLLVATAASAAIPVEPAAAASVPATSLLSSSFGGPDGRQDRDLGPRSRVAAAAAAALAPAAPAAELAPAAVAAALAAGQSMLLATSSTTPPAMRRSCWCLEDYSLQKRLYKGKMASVYRGRCLRSGLPVALKVYFKARVPSNVVHMVMREVDIHLAASEHRNVLKLYGVFQNEDVVVLVMELASRGSLAGICQGVAGGRLSEAQVRQTILDPLLDALSYLHGKGVCHRDIKPENLLFTADWGFRLADFGVSINLLEERAVTRTGTADYMAPEVERCPLKVHPYENKEDDSLAYTTAADVWSVGVLMYELLVGFPPMVAQGSNGGSLSFPASVSVGARDFITSALAHLPEERPTVRQLRCHPWMLAGGGAGAGYPGRLRDIVL